MLGTIFMGLATPTEAGAMGAVGAMVLAALHRRLTWPLVRQGMESTMRITVDGDLHPDRLDRVHAGVPGRRRRTVDRALLTTLPGGVSSAS